MEQLYQLHVALHPEGVDRNWKIRNWRSHNRRVALHPEGVDRNPAYEDTSVEARRSPSTRRAWIEIAPSSALQCCHTVALHPEGVDRNPVVAAHIKAEQDVALHPEGVDRNRTTPFSRVRSARSPSTRRAWIEMLRVDERGLWGRSPSTRRAWIEIQFTRCFRQSSRSPSTRRAWIEMANAAADSATAAGRPPPGGRG